MVVDLGCGGGLDVLLAAPRVGPSGRAIGIDMTPEMIDRARRNAAQPINGVVYTNVEFHLARIEQLPTVSADPRRDRRCRRLGVAGGLPRLAHDTAGTIAAAKGLHARAARPNLFIKIPGTKEGLPAIEEAIFAGVPVNVTLLFSREQYLAAAEAYQKGLERRIADGMRPDVSSVASMFISRWMSRSWRRCPRICVTSLASLSQSALTSPIAT